MFTRLDARWLSDTVLALYAARTVQEFTRVAGDSLRGKFSLLATACEELDAGLSYYAIHHLHTEVRPPDHHILCLHDNPFRPMLDAGRLPPIMHMRGCFSFEEWKRTDHYNGLARPMGWNDQCLIAAQRSPTNVHMGLQRDHPFSSREIALMTLLQPHLAAAWPRVKPAESELFHHESLRIPLSPKLRPLWPGAAARQLLRIYFPHWRETDRLPSELHNWVTQSLGDLQRPPPPRPLHAFTIEAARGRLLVRCYPGATGRPTELLLVESVSSASALPRPEQLGLTLREHEILHWLAQGKRDAEIAIILGLASGTVRKHVDNLRQKLGASSRGEAVHRALRWNQTR